MRTAILFISLLMAACLPERHRSELLHESGTVVAKQFRGEENASGSVVTVSPSGNIGFGIVSTHESERFDVVFRCEHGVVFTIDSPEIYSKVSEGDTVIIDYYEILFEDNTLYDLDFIDANRK